MANRSADPALRVKQARKAIARRKAELLRPKNPAAVILGHAGRGTPHQKKEKP